MRLIRFYHRFVNQYKIHHYWASLLYILKIAWIQSRRKKKEKIDNYIFEKWT